MTAFEVRSDRRGPTGPANADVPTPVSDSRSNKDEQIAHAAEVLRNSDQRRRVFEAIYHGKTKIKTRSKLEEVTGLNNKQVLTAGKTLADNQLVQQETTDGETAYAKDEFYSAHKAKILRLAANPDELARQPRSSQPRGKSAARIEINVSSGFIPPEEITIDDIDSFAKIKTVQEPQPKRINISEDGVKHGVQRVLGETGNFKDWGGEQSDLSTSRLKVAGRRVPTAFAFKGPGMTGKLTPGKMGKNGDQIQRLFGLEAQLFVVQYVGEIQDSVRTQMAGLAVARSAATGKKVRYCIIDGQDTARLVAAYPEEFADE